MKYVPVAPADVRTSAVDTVPVIYSDCRQYVCLCYIHHKTRNMEYLKP